MHWDENIEKTIPMVKQNKIDWENWKLNDFPEAEDVSVLNNALWHHLKDRSNWSVASKVVLECTEGGQPQAQA